jgi:hypothetical protein
MASYSGAAVTGHGSCPRAEPRSLPSITDSHSRKLASPDLATTWPLSL